MTTTECSTTTETSEMAMLKGISSVTLGNVLHC